MSFSNVLPKDILKFIGKHILIGLIKASGNNYSNNRPVRNTQCVKLTRNHKNVIQMVTYWCNLRVNQLQQMGATKETIESIVIHDARFLTALTHAVDLQKDSKPPYDAWLFFNDDVQSTDFFELQHCNCNTKITKVSYIIHNEC